MRGEDRPIGYVITLPNGYAKRRCEDGWHWVHYLVAEEKLGRPINSEVERVVFVNKDRSVRANPSPEDVTVKAKRPKTVKKQSRRQEALNDLEVRRRKLMEQEDDLRDEREDLHKVLEEVRTMRTELLEFKQGSK